MSAKRAQKTNRALNEEYEYLVVVSVDPDEEFAVAADNPVRETFCEFGAGPVSSASSSNLGGKETVKPEV